MGTSSEIPEPQRAHVHDVCFHHVIAGKNLRDSHGEASPTPRTRTRAGVAVEVSATATSTPIRREAHTQQSRTG